MTGLGMASHHLAQMGGTSIAWLYLETKPVCFNCISLFFSLFTCGNLKPSFSCTKNDLEVYCISVSGAKPVWCGSSATVFSWHSIFCHGGPSYLPWWALWPPSLYFQLNTFLLLLSSGSSCLSFGLQPTHFPLPKMLIFFFFLARSFWKYFYLCVKCGTS